MGETTLLKLLQMYWFKLIIECVQILDILFTAMGI
jgi:hypothetical protein